MKPLEKYTVGFTLGQFNFLSLFLFWRQTSNKYPGPKKKERGGKNKEKENIPFAHTVAGSWGSQLAKRGSYGHLTEPSIVPAADKSQLLDVVERRKQLLLNP